MFRPSLTSLCNQPKLARNCPSSQLSPPWGAPFLRHGVLNCIRVEKSRRVKAGKRAACVRVHLPLPVGVM